MIRRDDFKFLFDSNERYPLVRLNGLHCQTREDIQRCIYMFNHKEENTLAWIILLREAGNRLADKIIKIWSVKFYQEAETKLRIFIEKIATVSFRQKS